MPKSWTKEEVQKNFRLILYNSVVKKLESDSKTLGLSDPQVEKNKKEMADIIARENTEGYDAAMESEKWLDLENENQDLIKQLKADIEQNRPEATRVAVSKLVLEKMNRDKEIKLPTEIVNRIQDFMDNDLVNKVEAGIKKQLLKLLK
ncbi:hypothetical protein K491DRAFT_717952 [Lophiostoma macrostomum CBS 122681]|uniref:Uncharacterized protein n=1 Tax=Lophiostoma macrostomum CBS 122681 TaxID=1314788 RepID=A0A6A6T419_9PLEO|nr:hypothetical protein K491DRAFT_717952 [Lophiostoma macrostomum CBS 122681]